MSPFLSSVTHFLAATPLDADTLSDGEQSPDSLFDEPQESSTLLPKPPSPQGPRTTVAAYTKPENVHLTCTNVDADDSVIARRSAPPIPGLFFDPALLLPADLAESVLRSCMTSFFGDPVAGINQVMLFGRAGRENGESSSAFPPFLSALLAGTSALLRRHPGLPRETHAILFPERDELEHAPRARQAIVNLYRPGEGIKPHVDLLRRFGDGIVGVSLGSGVAMRFARDESQGPSSQDGGPYEVWLPPRSVLVLTGEARYQWTHGIESRLGDKVVDAGDGDGWQWDERGVRVSVTFRWLLPGAEIVGGDSDDGDDNQADRGRRSSGGNEKT